MEAKHTKGPWEAVEMQGGGWRVWTKEEDPVRGAFQVANTGQCPTVSEANSRLIATAPDLLAALEVGLAALIEARGWACETTSEDLDCSGCPQCQMRAAIAKARGI